MTIKRDGIEIDLIEVMKPDKSWFRVSKVYKSDKVFFSCCSCGIETTKTIGSFLSNKKVSLNNLMCRSCSTKKTNFEKWGYEAISQVPEIKEKTKNSYLKNLGVGNPMHLESSKEKIKQTSLKKWGVKSSNQAEEVKEKKIETSIKRYGVSTNLLTKENKEKSKMTTLKKFGVTNYRQSDVSKLNKKITAFKNHKKILEGKFIINSTPEEFEARKDISATCCICNTAFLYNSSHGIKPRCPTCYPTPIGGSYQEDEFYNFISTLTSENIIRSDRKILDGLEIDIFIPELNIGFEYDGIIWHGESFGKEKTYHLNKQKLAKSKGIDLFFIRSDEWLEKKEILKSIIKTKFNIIENKYYGRKCEIKNIAHKEADPFFCTNHIQGNINAPVYIGLFYNNELVSATSFGKERNAKNGYELYRYANKLNSSVIGGFSKMLKYFLNTYLPTYLITFSDKRLFNKNTYVNSGFIYSGDTDPNYNYYKNGNYAGSRIKFQKHKLPELLEKFDITLTEYDNMLINGYDRVWDCGNRKFIWKQ